MSDVWLAMRSVLSISSPLMLYIVSGRRLSIGEKTRSTIHSTNGKTWEGWERVGQKKNPAKLTEPSTPYLSSLLLRDPRTRSEWARLTQSTPSTTLYDISGEAMSISSPLMLYIVSGRRLSIGEKTRTLPLTTSLLISSPPYPAGSDPPKLTTRTQLDPTNPQNSQMEEPDGSMYALHVFKLIPFLKWSSTWSYTIPMIRNYRLSHPTHFILAKDNHPYAFMPSIV